MGGERKWSVGWNVLHRYHNFLNSNKILYTCNILTKNDFIMTFTHDTISFVPTCKDQNNGKQQKLGVRPKSKYLRMTKSPRRFLASNVGATPSHFYHVQYPYIIEPETIFQATFKRKPEYHRPNMPLKCPLQTGKEVVWSATVICHRKSPNFPLDKQNT